MYPSASGLYDVLNGHPPNGHDLMPEENINSEISHNLACLLSTTTLYKRGLFDPKTVKLVKREKVKAQIEKFRVFVKQ